MSEQNKRLQPLSQAEVSYTTVSPRITKGEACAACRWYYTLPEGSFCHLVETNPEYIEPTGWCERYEPSPKPEPVSAVLHIEDAADIVIEARQQKDEGNNRPGEGAASEPSESKMPGGGILGAIKQRVFGSEPDLTRGVIKTLGNGYWIAAYTNNLKDLEGEILSDDAHTKYLARVQVGMVPMPQLWLKHIPGTKHGEALWLWKDGHAVFAVGKFDDSPIGRAMEKHYKRAKPGDYELSHGFQYPRWAKKDGVYQDYTTFEITTIPTKWGRGANPFTSFEEIASMAISDRDKQMLAELLPDEFPRIEKFNNEHASKLKELANLGVAYKDFVDVTPQANTDAVEQTNKAVGALLSELVESQDIVISAVETQDKAIQALLQRMETRDKEWQAKLDAEQKARQALEAKINNKPRRVDDADAGNEVEDKEADDTLDKQQSGGEFDPQYPGMNIPLKTS